MRKIKKQKCKRKFLQLTEDLLHNQKKTKKLIQAQVNITVVQF